MDSFNVYFQLGIEHISDLQGYDHMLFILALCAIYKLQEWKKILILITAFTVGHSLTLALATLELVSISTELIETLIPATILLTAFSNYFHAERKKNEQIWLRYSMAMIFGLIHGLGFSNFLKSLLGKEENILLPLLAFNVGLEAGQILIVLVIMVLATFFAALQVSRRDWNMLLSGASGALAFVMILERAI